MPDRETKFEKFREAAAEGGDAEPAGEAGVSVFALIVLGLILGVAWHYLARTRG